MKRYKQLVLALMILCLTAAAVPAYAITPLKVAVLPVMNTAKYRYPEDLGVIQNTLIKPFKYPYYTLLPLAAVDDTVKQFLQANKGRKCSDQQVMAELAAKLSADLVVVAELSQLRLDRMYSYNYDDTYIRSDVALTAYAYSALTQKYDRIKVTKAEIEDESVDTNAPAILQDLTEQILVKLPYKRIPISP